MNEWQVKVPFGATVNCRDPVNPEPFGHPLGTFGREEPGWSAAP